MRSSPRSLALGVAAALATSSAAQDVRADDDRQAAAEKLLARGRSMMRSSATLAEGCRTLQKSYETMARGDTMLNLAECHRRQGKTASAWTEFDKAISYGAEAGFPEAIKTAMAFRASLWEKISRLTVGVSPESAAIPGLEVEVDEHPWPRERWNAPFIIDPGRVVVRARAPGYRPFEAQIDIGAVKDAKSVVVVLEPDHPVSSAAAQPATTRPRWPWYVGGAGILLGAGALIAEAVSVAAHNELDRECGGSARPICDAGYDFHPARTREVVGYGFFVGLGAASIVSLGAAGLGLGLSARAAPRGTSLVMSPTSIGVRVVFE